MRRLLGGGRGRFRPGLRGQFIGVALAAIGLPLALVMLVGLLMADWYEQPSMVRFVYATQELRKAVAPDGKGGLKALPGYSPPEKFHLVVVGGDGRIVMSTIPFLRPGEAPAVSAITAAARLAGGPAFLAGKSPSFFAETVEAGGETLGAYFAWLPPDDLRREVEADSRIARIAALALLGLLAVLVGAASAAKLTGAVLRLQRAAGAIAAGDLEVAVSERGPREIADLAAAMDSMRVRLREDRDRRARFLAAVSHDLRTPLTSIGGYLEAVQDGLAADPETLGRYVGIMREKTRVLESRIAGLIEFARMETGEWRMGFEDLDLGAFLESQARSYAEDAALAGRLFESDLAAARGRSVRADPALLARALENLVSNAVRFSPPGSTLRLSAAAAEGGLELRLDDEGPGIPPAERQSVFEPFVRGGGAGSGEGSGLGLYIARSVIEGHGWAVEAREAPGGGCRLAVLLGAPLSSPPERSGPGAPPRGRRSPRR